MQKRRMLLHDADAEGVLNKSIDAQFPDDDLEGATSLIQLGWVISLNAAFSVLHELSRPPSSAKMEKEHRLQLVSVWANGPDHPLKSHVLQAACHMIEGEVIPWREGVELLQRIGAYDGQRAALSIAYFASDCSSTEGDNELARTDAEIRKMWEAKGI